MPVLSRPVARLGAGLLVVHLHAEERQQLGGSRLLVMGSTRQVGPALARQLATAPATDLPALAARAGHTWTADTAEEKTSC